MEIPKILKHQFAVGQAEFATGHILKKDGTLFLEGASILEVYQVFDSLADAKKYITSKVDSNSIVECYILNFDGEAVYAYDKNGERKLIKNG